MLGIFVGRIDAGKVLEIPAACLLVKALGIPALGHGQRRVHEYLTEFAPFDARPRKSPLCAKWRNKRHQNDEAGVHHQPSDLGDAADIFDAVSFGKTEILIDSVADVVAIE